MLGLRFLLVILRLLLLLFLAAATPAISGVLDFDLVGKLHTIGTLFSDDLRHLHALGEVVAEVDLAAVAAPEAARPPRLFQGLPSSQCLLPAHLVLVELGKVVDYNGDGEGDD